MSGDAASFTVHVAPVAAMLMALLGAWGFGFCSGLAYPAALKRQGRVLAIGVVCGAVCGFGAGMLIRMLS